MANINVCCSVVRTKYGLMAFSRDKSGVASRRVYTGMEWKSEEIARDVSGGISVNVSDDGEIFVFCQDGTGNIVLHHFDGAGWKKQFIQESHMQTVYNLRIHSVIKNDGIHLLYNIPSKITGETRYKIVSQETSGGKWTPLATAAENVADAEPVFTVQNIAADHYAVYYQTGSMENSFGYKELYLPDKWGGFVSLHNTLNSFADKSVITTKDGIHAAFIVRGAYSCQLLYTNKLGPEISQPTVLFKANRIDNASLFLFEGNVHILFSAGGYGFFSIVSTDGGKTFSPPARISTAGFGRLIKAEYVSGGPQTPEFAVSDLFTDEENPGSALFLEDIYKDYYRAPETVPAPKPASTPVKNVEAAVEANKEKTVGKRAYDDLKELLEEETRKIAILENKLEGSYREISEKNRQIMELNSMLGKKNEETANVAESYRETVLKLRGELAEKERTIKEMRAGAAEKAADASRGDNILTDGDAFVNASPPADGEADAENVEIGSTETE